MIQTKIVSGCVFFGNPCWNFKVFERMVGQNEHESTLKKKKHFNQKLQ